MKRLFSINPLLFQVITTFLVMYSIFMLLFLTKGADRAGIITGIGLESSKTPYAIVTVVITIGLCLFFGLPIRIIPSFRNWWTPKPIINIALLIIGLLLVVLSVNSFFRHETTSTISGVPKTYSIRNPYPILYGWFLIAFSLLHFYPSTFLKRTSADVLTDKTDKQAH